MASTTFTSQGPTTPATGLHLQAEGGAEAPTWVAPVQRSLVERFGDRVPQVGIAEQLRVAVEAVLAFDLPAEEQESTAAAIARHRLSIAVGEATGSSRL